MARVPHAHRHDGKLPPGRAMWEGGDAVGAYGTTLALELLPYFTDGRIGSMEGLYFESSATVLVPLHDGERAREVSRRTR